MEPAFPSGKQIEIAHGPHHVTLVEVGGGLRSYTLSGRAVLDGYAAEEMCTVARGQTLIPWPNRVRDGRYRFAGEELVLSLTEPEQHNAIHGLTRWANWVVAERAPASVTFKHTLHAQPGYPFVLALELAYTLDDRGLTVRTSAVNVGSRPCPYATGAHPYLTVGTETIDSASLRVAARKWMPTGAQQIPTGCMPVEGSAYDFRVARSIGELRIDYAFTELERDAEGRARVELHAPTSGRSVPLWMDREYGYAEIFTGDTLVPARRRRGLGVEPMTCAPNAFQSGEGLRVLEPGERHSATWGIEAA